MGAFFEGALAGYAIAIPVGAIAILILDIAMRRGFGLGFAAGAGAATVDFAYASLAGLAGQALAPLLEPVGPAMQVVSAAVLLGLGGDGLWRLWRDGVSSAAPASIGVTNWWRTYAQFIALTLLNPATIAYFAALILGQNARAPLSGADRVWFVAGVWLSSFSWQTFLAWLGALAHRRLSPRVQRWTGVLGNVMVMALGVRMLF
jgi:arginine exporter protein ArgO